LGFDDTMLEYCRKEPSLGDVDDSLLAHSCADANENILRLLTPRVPWTMCQNLVWLLCALKHKLPGQGAAAIHFATAPKVLELAPLTEGRFPITPGHEYAENDVFYLETCLLSHLCRNNEELFSVEKGGFFECDFSRERYDELPAILNGEAWTLVDQLNHRYREGRPSSNLVEAGVLVHLFDGGDDYNKPWLPCTDNEWCRRFPDRVSLSLINQRVPFLYTYKEAGMIIAPFATEVLCSFATDGLSMAHSCTPPGPSDDGSCIPGCHGEGKPGGDSNLGEAGRPDWCNPQDEFWGDSAVEWQWDTHFCAWKPEDMQMMLAENELRKDVKLTHCDQKKHDGCRYNEIVVDADKWVSSLPKNIMAFFAPVGSGSEQRARRAHTQFLAAYPSSKAPLLRLNLSDAAAPFRPLS